LALYNLKFSIATQAIYYFTITTDKKGNFTGVKAGNTNYTLKEWKQLFTTQSPQNKQ